MKPSDLFAKASEDVISYHRAKHVKKEIPGGILFVFNVFEGLARAQRVVREAGYNIIIVRFTRKKMVIVAS